MLLLNFFLVKSQEVRSTQNLAAHRLIFGALGLSTKHLNNNDSINNKKNNVVDEKPSIDETGNNYFVIKKSLEIP